MQVLLENHSYPMQTLLCVKKVDSEENKSCFWFSDICNIAQLR